MHFSLLWAAQLNNSFFPFFFSFFLSPIQLNGDVALFWLLFIIISTDWDYAGSILYGNGAMYCVLCMRCSYTQFKMINKIKSTNINHFGVFVSLLFSRSIRGIYCVVHWLTVNKEPLIFWFGTKRLLAVARNQCEEIFNRISMP